MSPHSGAGSGFRIRIRFPDGYKEKEHFLPGEDPHQTGSNVVKYVTKLAFKTSQKKNVSFCVGLCLLFSISGAKLGSKPGGGMGGAGWIHARKESGK